MKRRIVMFALFFLYFSLVHEINAQVGWFWQNPVPQGNTLLAVSFSDDNNGTAVGSYGTIIHTTDSGYTWINQESGTRDILRDVSFPDENNGTAVGDHGLILNTKDGGQTWNAQTSGTTEALYGVNFSDADHGTAVGVMGTILRTADGGSSWTAQSSSVTGTFCNLSSVAFVDVNNGAIVGSDGIVLHTTDGGNSWISQSSGTTKALSSVSFLDENNGIAVGRGGTTIMTNDAGASWRLMQMTENHLNDVSFSDINNILIVGDSHTVVRITDKGTSANRYYQVGEGDFLGASNNTLVGKQGQIFRTYDEGKTWVDQRAGSLCKLRGVSFTSENIGTAVGHNGTILRTTDGGSTWSPQSYNSPFAQGSLNDHLRAVSFSDDNNGYVVSGVSYGDSSGITGYPNGLILRTTNGGSSWEVPYYYDHAAFNGVSSPSANTCFAVGVYQILENKSWMDRAGWASTTDGGVNWRNRYFNSITDPLTDVSFVNDSVGTMVGYKGRIMRTIDGGYNWKTQTSGTDRNLRGVCFTDSSNGTVVGDYGIILHTADGGASWQTQTSGIKSPLYSVSFADRENGIISGLGGLILKSDDGGATWEIQQSRTDQELFAVSMVDQSIGVAVGDNGTILRKNTDAVVSVFAKNTPVSLDDYLLSQNYPNPFNELCSINYKVPVRAKVSLKVFNLTGREIMTLIEKVQQPGRHTVTFNASGLPSGIYLYRLNTASQVLTRKMTLIR